MKCLPSAIFLQAKCIKTIKEFKNRGVTILFVSHNMSDVEKICDRVVWIENHRLRKSVLLKESSNFINKQWPKSGN
jgi:ABC-type polysaccharide/polyol phosphate transport system ATPase subunit